jgi:hypothetical protein
LDYAISCIDHGSWYQTVRYIRNGSNPRAIAFDSAASA